VDLRLAGEDGSIHQAMAVSRSEGSAENRPTATNRRATAPGSARRSQAASANSAAAKDSRKRPSGSALVQVSSAERLVPLQLCQFITGTISTETCSTTISTEDTGMIRTTIPITITADAMVDVRRTPIAPLAFVSAFPATGRSLARAGDPTKRQQEIVFLTLLWPALIQVTARRWT